MSFDSDPFKIISIIEDKEGYYRWLCDSCGATSKLSGTNDMPLLSFLVNYEQHLHRSHRISREDTKNWYSEW